MTWLTLINPDAILMMKYTGVLLDLNNTVKDGGWSLSRTVLRKDTKSIHSIPYCKENHKLNGINAEPICAAACSHNKTQRIRVEKRQSLGEGI